MSDTEEPPLPPIRDGSSPPPFHPSKRSRGYASSNSSDVPFFSSDDLADASVAKSTTPRRRKQYRRAWYEEERPSQAHSYRLMKTLTKKPKDSGVFLSSDSSNSSPEDGFSVANFNFKKPENKKMSAFAPTRTEPASAPKPKPVLMTSQDDEIVDEVVRRCLDNCNEAVDLNNLGLKEITTSAFGGLRSMIKPPTFDKCPVPEGAFKPLIPELKIFLSANRLQQVPREIFELGNLTVLSLRNNDLVEISPAIRNCTGLRELNVASNQLRWLPYEMLSLLWNPQTRMISLRSRPNPFVQPCPPPRSSQLRQSASDPDPLISLKQHLRDLQKPEAQTQNHASILQAEWLLHLISAGRNRINKLISVAPGPLPYEYEETLNCPIYLAMTPAAYFRSDGTVVPGKSAAPPSSMPLDQQYLRPVDDDWKDTAHDESNTNQSAPSLFELCLRTCAASGQLAEIFTMFPSDQTPAPVLSGLHAAEAAIRESRICGFCERRYVTPRAEWIEYWGYCPRENADHSPDRVMESVLPFLRRACSWGCARGARSQGREKREDIFVNEWLKVRGC
ncbi:MAG: hypothetical protein M1831_007458 [Alyxoria varia]|nr:MAG: hypothetical protein M1831_007458 [Alyxoria varia]